MRPARSRPGARLISLRDAENEYGIPKDTLRKLIERGELRAIEPPGVRRVFLVREDVEAAIESWTRKAS